MKKAITIILLLTLCISTVIVPVSATIDTTKKYDEAKKFISNIDFDYYYNLTDLGDDVKNDLKNIEEYVSSHSNYTMEDLNEIIVPADENESRLTRASYDYTKLLPTSKDMLNNQEKEIFNSNSAYGLSVLLQGSYANSQELSRFGSNTWGTNGDAFRHAVWNALGTYYTSESYMKKFATAHETGSADYDANSVDTKMDLQNNASGRSLFKSMNLPSDSPNGMAIPNLISNNIATATKNGKLVRFVVSGVQYSTLRATNSATSN